MVAGRTDRPKRVARLNSGEGLIGSYSAEIVRSAPRNLGSAYNAEFQAKS
jgi:hypothetical protein